MASKNEVVDVEEVGLVHVPKKQEEQSHGMVNMEAGKSALDSIYDHYQKKIYVFDRSWSMESGMAPEDERKQYLWEPATLKKFRDLIADEMTAEVIAGDLDEDESKQTAAELADDAKLVDYILQHQIHRRPDLEPPKDPNAPPAQTERKIQAVRGAMKRFVEKRFNQYPDAQVGMIGFGSQSYIMCYPGAPKPEVMMAIEALQPDMGGTDICGAIDRALSEFKTRPSHVGSHHLVMVTDAEASMTPGQAEDFLRTMKQLNVMFDFIYVKGQSEHSYYGDAPDSIVNLLKRMCKETGGEYAEVSKSSDFEVKFFQASERKALPPAR